MRCPTCRRPISWVPREDGRRVAVGVNPVTDGNWYLDVKGVLRAYHPGAPKDVPRYATHAPCPEEVT